MNEMKTSQHQINEQVILQAFMHNTMDDAIYFKDVLSRFIWVNDVLVKRLGAESSEDMYGKTDFDFFTREHAQQAFDDEMRIVRSGKPLLNVEEKETYADGHVSWASTSKMPLKDKQGRIIGTFGISRNITAHKLAEERLVQTQKELLEASRLAGIAEISSGVLHNIGNALNSVTTSVSVVLDHLARSRLPNLGKACQMLEQHQTELATFLTEDTKGRQLPPYLIQLSQALLAEREQCHSELETLRNNVEHVKGVVAMQQEYAKVSDISEDVPPSELIEEAIRISETSLNRHGIMVAKVLGAAPVVHVARHKVLQILVNFIQNAKHALDDSGRQDKEIRVVLSTTSEGRVRFVVMDNGVGIEAENLKRIFSFGFTTRKHGHGFGLHSCANAATELKGMVKVESEGPGKGAAFTLEIPAAAHSGA